MNIFATGHIEQCMGNVDRFWDYYNVMHAGHSEVIFRETFNTCFLSFEQFKRDPNFFDGPAYENVKELSVALHSLGAMLFLPTIERSSEANPNNLLIQFTQVLSKEGFN